MSDSDNCDYESMSGDEVNDEDEQGITYLPAEQLINPKCKKFKKTKVEQPDKIYSDNSEDDDDEDDEEEEAENKKDILHLSAGQLINPKNEANKKERAAKVLAMDQELKKINSIDNKIRKRTELMKFRKSQKKVYFFFFFLIEYAISKKAHLNFLTNTVSYKCYLNIIKTCVKAKF